MNFNLPEEKEEFESRLNAPVYLRCLQEVHQLFRTPTTEPVTAFALELEKRFHEILARHDLGIYCYGIYKTMKATLHFNLPEEKEEYEALMSGPVYLRCLQEIYQELFRAPRKHGYTDPVLKQKLALCDELKILNAGILEPVGTSFVAELEKRFHEILAEHDMEI